MANGTTQPTRPFPRQSQPRPGLDAEMDTTPRNRAPDYTGSGKLRDRRALITGGGSGIGAAVAGLHAREGADLAIVYLPDEQQGADNVKRLVGHEGRRCLQLPGDVKDSDFCRRAVERTVEGLDVLRFLGHPPLLGYAETKGANHTFTKAMATGLIERGVRVNCVSPGPVSTPLNASARTPEQMAGSSTPPSGSSNSRRLPRSRMWSKIERWWCR